MSGGVGAALDEAVDALPDGAAIVQASLFDAEEVGAFNAPSPLSAALTPRKGPGRTKGARNRRTEAVAGWLLSQGRHPVLVMMEAYAMTPAQLAAQIGMKGTNVAGPGEPAAWVYDDALLLEVYKLQLRMAEAAAPYVAQKLPQAHQVEATAGLTVTFAGVSLPARAGPAGNSGQVGEGERPMMNVTLPFKSDDQSRTDAQDPE